MSKNKFLSIVIVVILLTNLAMLSKIEDLQNQINNSHQYSSRLQSDINNISGNVDRALNRFVQEQSWITAVQINYEKTTVGDEQGSVVLNWQIKDWPEGAAVFLHHRRSEAEEFVATQAIDKGSGFYEVTIPVEVKVEPYWEIGVSAVTEGNGGFGTKRAEMMAPKSKGQSLNCYVSMKTTNGIKSSSITSFSLVEIARMKYEPIRGHIDINHEKYNVNIVEYSPSNYPYQAVRVKIFNNDVVVIEKELTAKDNQKGVKEYTLSFSADPTQAITHVVLQVQYQNGKIFEKEVFRNGV